MPVLSDIQMISIAIADDQQLVLEGLKALLKQINGIEILFTSNDGTTLLGELENTTPQVILMDIRMPGIDGLEATKLVKAKFPDIFVIVLSNYGDLPTIKNSLKAGADGYLLKNIEPEELKIAIEKVAEGETYFCKDVQDKILGSLAKRKIQLSNDCSAVVTNITKRELEVLLLICEEYTSEGMAAELFISKNTVETHRKHLMNKLNCKTSIGLALYAIKHNLYKI